jgi:ADP-ribose pyrophosphatase
MSTTKLKGKSLAWTRSTKKILHTPNFDVYLEHVLEPSAISVKRYIIRHPGSVVILAVDESSAEPRVVLERQYRHAAKTRMWELPAGSLEPGEATLPAARRELQEETGYLANRWRKVLFFYVSPGFLGEHMTVYLARGLKKGPAHPEDDERISVRLFPLTQAIKMAMTGKIIDAKTIAGLLWLATTDWKI